MSLSRASGGHDTETGVDSGRSKSSQQLNQDTEVYVKSCDEDFVIHDQNIGTIATRLQRYRQANFMRSKDYVLVPGPDADEVISGALAEAAGDQLVQMGVLKRGTSWSCWWTILTVAVFLVFTMLLLVNALLGIQRQAWGDEDKDLDAIFSNWGCSGSGTEGRAWYPTDFLRDVVPIPCHSHNDYWRKVPLFSALHAGCTGVEADVWLQDGELYIGHNAASLQPNRTFRSLYIDPLVEILKRQNTKSRFYNGSNNGVFDMDPTQTLTLLVDVKTDGHETWPVVLEHLDALRKNGWLRSFKDGEVYHGLVTVVGTGNTPYEQIVANKTYRDAFFDAPLDQLANSTYDYTNSYYASVSWLQTFGAPDYLRTTPRQIGIIRSHATEAHRRHLKARYWELPPWPLHVRFHIWDVLVREGIDVLNVDDLKGAAFRDWTKLWPF